MRRKQQQLNFPKNPLCLHPDCQRDAHTRGLCRSHYQALHALVVDGDLTFDDAVKAGKCLAFDPAKNWFLEAAPKRKPSKERTVVVELSERERKIIEQMRQAS